MPQIRDNVLAVTAAIKNKLSALGRDPEDAILVAVTKTHPVEAIEAALEAGLGHFGENKVQEAQRKVPFITRPYEGFHFIGHLQTNKIKALLELKPCLIHSIDSLYLAESLNAALARFNRVQDILVQVNTTQEASKSGVDLSNAIEMVGQISQLPFLRVKGLMTIGLMSIDAERTRPHFQKLKQVFDQIKTMIEEGSFASGDPGSSAVEMRWLSMGMSDDFLVALEEGSNMLRLGSVLFGARNYGSGK